MLVESDNSWSYVYSERVTRAIYGDSKLYIATEIIQLLLYTTMRSEIGLSAMIDRVIS